jgi:ribosomal protein S18 acetylase RimI-like enzyme
LLMPVNVRLARGEDQGFIEALGLETALETVSPVRAVTKHDADQAFRRLVAFCRERAGTVFLLAETNGQRAGFLILLTDVPDDVTHMRQAFVAYVAVRSEDRGRGVGRALIQAAIAEGERRNLPHISLMVSANNVAARALYESEHFLHDRILMCRRIGTSEAS